MSTSESLADNLGVIQVIEELEGYQVRPVGPLEGSAGAQAGFLQMLGFLGGHTSMEGFRVLTDKHELLILIDDRRSCCESWGHVHSADSADDLKYYTGATLNSVRLTDMALNSTILKQTNGADEYGFEDGGIQFVDLDTDRGKLQLAVYNAYNGYYGHGIVVALDDVPLHEDTL